MEKRVSVLAMTLFMSLVFPVSVFADVQSGGGITLTGHVDALPGLVSDGNIRSVMNGNPIAQKVSGNGFTLFGGIYYVSSTPVQSQPPVAPPPVVPPSSGGSPGVGVPSAVPTSTVEVPSLPTGSVEEIARSAQAKKIDIVKDGVINILDFNGMMVHWGETTCGDAADMNGDCVVDIFDFNTLMVYWGANYSL